MNAIAPGLTASEAVRENPMYPRSTGEHLPKPIFRAYRSSRGPHGNSSILASDDSDLLEGNYSRGRWAGHAL